jgi:hypothetical protein
MTTSKHLRKARKWFLQLQAEHNETEIEDDEDAISIFSCQKVSLFSGETKFIFSSEFLKSGKLLKCDALKDLLHLVEAAYAASLAEYEAKLVRMGAKPDQGANAPRDADNDQA